jgi:hypothetical protein
MRHRGILSVAVNACFPQEDDRGSLSWRLAGGEAMFHTKRPKEWRWRRSRVSRHRGPCAPLPRVHAGVAEWPGQLGGRRWPRQATSLAMMGWEPAAGMRSNGDLPPQLPQHLGAPAALRQKLGLRKIAGSVFRQPEFPKCWHRRPDSCNNGPPRVNLPLIAGLLGYAIVS